MTSNKSISNKQSKNGNPPRDVKSIVLDFCQKNPNPVFKRLEELAAKK